MNSQNHTDLEICYKMAVFQYSDIVVSIVANSNEKCIMQFLMANQTSKCLAVCPK